MGKCKNLPMDGEWVNKYGCTHLGGHVAQALYQN